MTKTISVDDFPAGPRLDAEVAHILGWTELQKMEHCDDWKGKNPEGHPYVIPRYSTDIGAAWKLVEKSVTTFLKHGFTLEVRWQEVCPGDFEREYQCTMNKAEAWDCNTAPLAIARAFLKTSGVKEIETEDE